jgi:LCP family protein required for cell wall assembly
MTIRQNDSAATPKTKFDRGRLIILGVFLVLALAAAVATYRLSQRFFATTTFIGVGDAPPVVMAQPGQNAAENPQAGDVTPGAELTPQAPVANIDPAPRPWDGTRRVTLLVMGLDYRDWSEGVDIPRTDTMILFSIDPLSKTAGMISIPRDMWVSIPGFGYSRINAAYRTGEMYKLPGGGTALAAKTVELFLGVPVDYVALIDFKSFVRFVDELGGLDMHIREEITVDPIGPGNTKKLEPGVQALDGATVLAYARMRYTKDGDFDRSKRQQEVIMALRNQVVQFNQLPMLVSKAPKLYEELSSGIRTNLSLDQAIQLAWLAVQIDEKNIKKGVFDPHKDVGYAAVVTSEGRADVLVPNPDQIRLLRDSIFASGETIGPSAEITDPTERMKAENARVLMRNGTLRPEVSQQGGDTLRALGVNLIAEDAAGREYANTTFIDHTGKPYTIKYLMEKLNVPASRIEIAFDPNAGADVEIIIGNDWAGPQ